MTIRPARTISRKGPSEDSDQLQVRKLPRPRSASSEWESSEAIRRAPCRSAGMKRWSRPRSDTGVTVLNYNRPKVAEAPLQARGAAPPNGDVGECSWLFAGKPGASEWYSSSCNDGSDNPVGGWHDKGHTGKPAGNRSSGILRDHTPAVSWIRDEEMVRSLRRRKEVGRDDRPASQTRGGPQVTVISEIPCRVDELPGERVISHASPANNGETLLVGEGRSRGKSRASAL